MKNLLLFVVLFSSLNFGLSQTIDQNFSKEKMRADLDIFKQIRITANSGLYKYRTETQIDSIYNWASQQIEKSDSYRDFYNIICKLTDFEGSLHNSTDLSEKLQKALREEKHGYFPYPIIWVDGEWRINFNKADIPFGSKIIKINELDINEIISVLNKYYTTDGINLTGKRVGMRTHFSKYFRFHYGLQDSFELTYESPKSDSPSTAIIKSVGYKDYYRNFIYRHSRKIDAVYYKELDDTLKYSYEVVNPTSALLKILDLSIGDNAESKAHAQYQTFLESIFESIKQDNIENLIVDVRYCGGGTDPNDVLSFSFLSSRPFQESKQVWSSFQKLPFLKYYNSSVPRLLRPLGVWKYNREFKRRFPNAKDGKFFISKDEDEMKIWQPHKNSFGGNIFLLINPEVASAGSLFAALVAGNKNTTTIGEETMGAYYGHNGHTPLEYVLPNSKIVTGFFMDNIIQDVPLKANQPMDRGILPDHFVTQSLNDFIANEDAQVRFVLELIQKKY